jgi:hypothetical protein
MNFSLAQGGPMKKLLPFLILGCCLFVLHGCASGSAQVSLPPSSTATVAHFSINAPPSVTSGAVFNLSITAVDSSGNFVSTYSGIVHFTSNDPLANLPIDQALTGGAGTFKFSLGTTGSHTITAFDKATDSISGSASIDVISAGGLTITSGPPSSGTVNVRYGTPHPYCCNVGKDFNEDVFQFTASGGSGNYSWSWAAAPGSSLPPGLNCCSLDISFGFPLPHTVFLEGVIYGTPAAAGTYNIVVTARDNSLSLSQSAPYAINIIPPPPPAINTNPLPIIGSLNAPYTFTFTATNGQSPLVWMEKGGLPGTLQLNADGVLSGTPNQVGSFPITVSVQDALQQKGIDQEFTIQILQHGFKATGSMETPRTNHAAVLLNDGRVLVTGGLGDQSILNSAEIFDPSNGIFAPTGNMGTTRIEHTATTLQDGRVLVTGGIVDRSSESTITTEIFDPASNSFSPTGPMASQRYFHTATLLNDGRVLVAGGFDGAQHLATAELFDPATGKFTPAAGTMATGRLQHAATLLKDGRVLISGGVAPDGSVTATVEIFDPTSNTFASAGSMATARSEHTATLLCDPASATCDNQKVLVAGGSTVGPTAELYDPLTNTFSSLVGLHTPRSLHTATLLPSGMVLVAGGKDTSMSALSSAELFDPATGNFNDAADMTVSRESHTANLLKTGAVLVTGGLNTTAGFATLGTAELYQ